MVSCHRWVSRGPSEMLNVGGPLFSLEIVIHYFDGNSAADGGRGFSYCCYAPFFCPTVVVVGARWVKISFVDFCSCSCSIILGNFCIAFSISAKGYPLPRKFFIYTSFIF